SPHTGPKENRDPARTEPERIPSSHQSSHPFLTLLFEIVVILEFECLGTCDRLLDQWLQQSVDGCVLGKKVFPITIAGARCFARLDDDPILQKDHRYPRRQLDFAPANLFEQFVAYGGEPIHAFDSVEAHGYFVVNRITDIDTPMTHGCFPSMGLASHLLVR